VSQTIGYARVSADDQHLDLQLDALKAAGCDRVFEEKASGALKERPELAKALEYLRPGDVLVIWKLDRLGRSLRHLVDTVAGLSERGVGLRSLKENIDTTTATGRLIFHIFAALAEFERDMLHERAEAGRAAARARGKLQGRKPVMTLRKLAAAQLLIEGGASLRQAAETIGVGKSTLHAHLVQKLQPAKTEAPKSSGQDFGTALVQDSLSGVRPSAG
jgi:DNA invertase Pin-like site-specific DNA recombinase